jgi:hypothetical protein
MVVVAAGLAAGCAGEGSVYEVRQTKECLERLALEVTFQPQGNTSGDRGRLRATLLGHWVEMGFEEDGDAARDAAEELAGMEFVSTGGPLDMRIRRRGNVVYLSTSDSALDSVERCLAAEPSG